MPTSAQILALLTASAHAAIPVAIGWHVVVLAALVALALGWRPSNRVAGQLLALPFLSVGVVSMATANPFNAIVFTLLAVVLAVLGRRGPPEPVSRSSPGAVGIGIAMLALGWLYPHFLHDRHPLTYLYAAPTGVVPCATLYLVIGFALVGRIGGRAWAAVLAGLGLVYGLTGVILLGVALDVGLIVGGVALAAGLRASPRASAPWWAARR